MERRRVQTAWPRCPWAAPGHCHSPPTGTRTTPEHDIIRPTTTTPGHFRYKTLPAHPPSPHVRYKTLPARATRPHFRYKTLPARPKWLNLALFLHAGRVLYRCHHQEAEQGEFCTERAAEIERANTTHQAPPACRAPKEPEGPEGSGDRGAGRPGRGAGGRLAGPTRVRRASARKISHIISHGHFSRPPENVAIPTMQIQCLNKLLGNYVRNCSDGSKTPAKQISHAIRLDQISTNPENVAIPTMQIQCLNKLLGNCMRNCCADGPGRGAGGQRQGRGSVGPGTVPGTVAGRQTRQNSPGTAPPPLNPRQNSPSNLKNVKFGVFRARRANFFAHRTR